MLCQYGFLEYNDGYPKARLSVLDAITRNPNLAEAYTSLGWIQFAYEWKLKDSEENYRKAIKLNPKNAQAHQWLGLNLQTQGRRKESYESLLIGKLHMSAFISAKGEFKSIVSYEIFLSFLNFSRNAASGAK